MTLQKKFLRCTMLVMLSPCFFTAEAAAVTIVNLDNVPHNVTLEVASKETTISLMPYERWNTSKYPVKIKYANFTSPALDVNGEYAIWSSGDIALQLNRKTVNRRY